MKITSVYFCLFIIAVFLSVACQAAHESFSNRRRRTKELDEKINKLGDATKQRVYAMKAAGMPKEAIAEKISYEVGGKGTAQRVVDALHNESPKPKAPPKKPPSSKAKTSSSSSSASSKTSSAKAPTSSTQAKAPTAQTTTQKKAAASSSGKK